MSPEERAKHLVIQFYNLRSYETMAEAERRAAWGISKQSALVAVDEIIGELNQLRKPEYTTFILEYADPDVAGDPGETMDGYEKIDYWRQVKQHIENL